MSLLQSKAELVCRRGAPADVLAALLTGEALTPSAITRQSTYTRSAIDRAIALLLRAQFIEVANEYQRERYRLRHPDMWRTLLRISDE